MTKLRPSLQAMPGSHIMHCTVNYFVAMKEVLLDLKEKIFMQTYNVALFLYAVGMCIQLMHKYLHMSTTLKLIIQCLCTKLLVACSLQLAHIHMIFLDHLVC